jgi:hypothetical protein
MSVGNKIIATFPFGVIDEEAKNWRPAGAEIPQAIAGASRWLHEFATGGPCNAGEEYRGPINPQGLPGHDHSGPPFGPAMRHTLFAWSATYDTGKLSRSGTIELNLAHPSEVLRGYGDVKAHPSWVARTPYSRGYVSIRGKTDSGTCSVDVTLEANGRPKKTETIEFTTTDTVLHLDNFLDLVSARNYFTIGMTKDTLTPTVSIVSISVSQIVKRSHPA